MTAAAVGAPRPSTETAARRAEVGAVELRGFEGLGSYLGERLPGAGCGALTGCGGDLGTAGRRRLVRIADGAARAAGRIRRLRRPPGGVSGRAGLRSPDRGRAAPACCAGSGRYGLEFTGRRDDRAPCTVGGSWPTAPSWRPTWKVKRGPSGLAMLMLWPSRISTTLHPATVDEHPGRRTVVDRYPFAAIESQHQMRAGDQRMGNPHVGAQVGSNDHVLACRETAL